MKYRAEIDGLRAVAVIPVILFHANLPLFGGGFVGVDIFFVISGYLITSILIEDIENKRFSIVNFYERRARRILPALFFVMLCCIPFAWMWMVPSQMKDFSQSLVATSLFSSNILFWSETDYFAAAAEAKPLLHTWSLAVEEQYYLLFPLFLFFAWRFGKNRVFWIIVVMAAISLALCEWGWRNLPAANFYLAPARVWELFAGSIAAFVVRERGVKKNNLLATIGLGAILFAIFAFDESTPFPSLYALVPVIGVVLLVLYAEKDTLVAKLLGTRLLVGIGLISYSAYLWHQPLFAFARIRAPGGVNSDVLMALSGLAIAAAYLSWRYIERPFRNKSLFNRNQLFYVSAIFLALPISIGAAGHLRNGFLEEKASSYQKLLLTSAVPSPKRGECHAEGKHHLSYNTSCNYFEGSSNLAAFGDSHIVELAYALADELQSKSIRVKHLSFSGCIPSYESTIEGYEDCAEWTNDSIRHLIDDDSIVSVVVSYRINASLFGEHDDLFPVLPQKRSPEQREQIWNSYVHILQSLVAANKNVILVLQAPELPKRLEDLVFRDQSSQDDINGVTKDWWMERTAFVRSRLNEIPRAVTVIDPMDIFCNGEMCLAAAGGVAYYFDDNHMSVEGARLVAREIIPAMHL